MKVEERLNDIIEEKELEIDELKEKVQRLESFKEMTNFSWMIHENFKETKLHKGLPVPRLEMRLKRIGPSIQRDNWFNIEWVYGLVYKHYAETEDDILMFIPFSRTKANGGKGTFDNWKNSSGKLNTPYRDGMHILVESKLFNLPAYMICEEMEVVHKIDPEGIDDSTLEKRARKLMTP